MKNPLKNDFVDTCKKYLQILKIDLSFIEIENLSTWSLKKIVKEKTEIAAFRYLLEQQKKPRKNGKLSKIANIKYDRLELQPYLVVGNHGTQISQFIFKARSQTLDIKTQKNGSTKMHGVQDVKVERKRGMKYLLVKNLENTKKI